MRSFGFVPGELRATHCSDQHSPSIETIVRGLANRKHFGTNRGCGRVDGAFKFSRKQLVNIAILLRAPWPVF